MYEKFKNFGKIIYKIYGSIISNSGSSSSLKTGTIAAFFHKLWKVSGSRLRLKINLRTGT
jgi:hypothetical protein